MYSAPLFPAIASQSGGFRSGVPPVAEDAGEGATPTWIFSLSLPGLATAIALLASAARGGFEKAPKKRSALIPCVALVAALFAALASTTPARAVTISDTDHEGRTQFKIETKGATYFFDRAGGGFSRMLDPDGRDWIAFKQKPATGRGGSAAAFRGVPNLLFGKTNPDAGAGHPGFDLCESTIIAADAIRTVTKSGRWAWTWRFTEQNAELTIEQADPDHAYWFLYEGPIGGRWSPRTSYWGTNRGGPRRESPFGKDKLFDQWRWVYFGEETAPRVLLALQVASDTASETLWYMGNAAVDLDSPDGMIVFGFGRGENGPELRGAGQKFVIGFVEGLVKDGPAHARVAATAWEWIKRAESTLRVSETTLHGDVDCFRIETPTATYLYGKRGAGFASILDPQGRDWIGYRHGGKAAGEYRGLPKNAPSGGYFHCDYGFGKDQTNFFKSTVTLNEPGHVRIHSETKDGEGACDWDFYPTHATQTLLKFPGGGSWFTYEGAPGGQFDLAEDFTIRPGDRRAPLSEPWTDTVPWIMVGAKESSHGLLLVNHQTGSPVDSYTPFPYQLNEKNPAYQMAVVAFGRSDWRDAPRKHKGQFSRLSARFSIAMTPAATASAAAATLQLIGTPATGATTGNLFAPPSIDVWYGDKQHFGRLGVPQKWVNLLGRVTAGDGLASLHYSLTRATPVRLSVGADGYRLARRGDFNADIDFDSLRDGANQVVLTVVDATGRSTERTVTVICHRGHVWPLPYTVDWSKVKQITDAVQIVDGRWQLEPGGARILDPHYDRILAFGDRTWTDYTVTAEVTFHNYAPPLGRAPTYGVSHAALAARYPGHFADKLQPHVQWYPVGAVAEFRLGADLAQSSWRIFIGGSPTVRSPAIVEPQPRNVELGVRYVLKIRVDTLPGPAARYRVKSWQAGQPEPAAWEMDTTERTNVLTSGGALVVSHNTDVTIGLITANPNDPREP